jgi:hypothetical protein
MTDVETLADNGLGLSCINFSCGYYNPHTDNEYTEIDELWNCLGFAFDIISNCTKVYPHTRKKEVYYGGSWYNKYGYGSYGRKWYYDYYDKEDDTKLDDTPESDNGIFIPDFKDYAEPLDAVYDFVWQNEERGYDAYAIFDYIEADCETYGIEFEEYCDIVNYLTGDCDKQEEVDDLPEPGYRLF